MIFKILIDIFLINLSYIVSFFIRFGYFPERNFLAYKHIWPFISVFYFVSLYIAKQYDTEEYTTYFDIVYRNLVVTFLGFLAISFIVFFARTFAFPRTVIVISSIFIFIFLNIHHVIWRFYKKFFPIPLAILAKKENADLIYKQIKNKSSFFYVKQVIFKNDGYINLKKLMKDENIKDILINSEDFNKDNFIENMEFFIENKFRIWLIPGMYEVFFGHTNIKEIAGIPCWLINHDIPSWYAFIKRAMDILISLFGILFFSPLFPFIALLIKLDSKGPIFYTQYRIGKDGKRFKIIKFRSMIKDAERISGPVWAKQNDSRITKVGKWLRRLRIDEIPQLINVLLGDMSIVGPRPEREFFIEKFVKKYPFFKHRLLIKPGLTGLSQIKGDYDLNPYSKLKYDFIYIYNRSFLLDLKIILDTIKIILNAKGH